MAGIRAERYSIERIGQVFRMKFLFVGNFFKNENYGAPGHVIQPLNDIGEKGHLAHAIFRDDLLGFSPKKNIMLNTILFIVFPVMAAFKMLFLDIRNRYDFVVVSSGDGFFYAILTKIFFLTKHPLLIMRSHGHEFLYKKEYKRELSMSKRSHFRVRERVFLFSYRILQVTIFSHLCDNIFVMNRAEGDYLERSFMKDKISVIPTGVKPVFAVPAEAKRGRDILFVGGWCHLKGCAYFVDIIKILNDRKSDLTVSVIGTGLKDGDVIADFPEEMADRIRVIRLLPKDMLKEEYLNHKVFLFPSLFEGFGKVVLEAMVLGMAVVVSEGLGVSEVISDGRNGFLVPKRDVERFASTAGMLLDDPQLRERVGENARRTAAGMRSDRIADMFIDRCMELRNG